MGKIRSYQIKGLNLHLSPFLSNMGELLRSVNVDTEPIGAKIKRPGYVTYLGTMPNGSSVHTLFNWTKDDGTTFWNYAGAGANLYYSSQGTGAWTVCGGGTLTAGSPIGYAVQNNTLIIGDGAAATRHTTNGTSFTNTSLAPVGQYWATYQNRAYVGGTGSVLTYSVTNDITNWNTTGTSDSSSIIIPGAGKINQVFVASDRLNIPKTSNNIFRWDGYNLFQVPTNQGPSSPLSLAQLEDFWVYLNRNGIHIYNGDRPSLISIPISRQISNDLGKGIAGTTFDNAPGVGHQYNYLLSVGTITDNLTLGTVPDAILKYDYLHNEWGNYQFAHRPLAWLSYKDNTQSQQLIFAGGSQCYTFGGTATDDAGSTIESVMEGALHLGAPESDKEWKYMWAFFNPGAEAKVQVAMANTFTTAKKNWIDLGDCKDGVAELRFPAGARSKLLFWKIYDASRNVRFNYYGFSFEADIIDRK